MLNSSGLASQGDLDIKDSIGVRLYQTPEQQADTKYGKTYAHTNGVVFEGKVVNFEWLGHYIFGARKGSDKLAPGFVYDVMADREQATTSANTSVKVRQILIFIKMWQNRPGPDIRGILL